MHNMKLVDMAKSKAEVAEEKAQYSSPAPYAPDIPLYPYGLCISLCQDELEKLGLGVPEVGNYLQVLAICKVTSVSSRETDEGTTSRVELQITHMGLEDDDAEEAEMIHLAVVRA